MAMTMLAGLLAGQPLTAVAAAVLAGALLAVVLALIVSVARAAVAIPMIRRACALREKSRGAAFGRQRDPDAPGRARPRAPSAAQAAAMPA
jgi:hypothetical protein